MIALRVAAVALLLLGGACSSGSGPKRVGGPGTTPAPSEGTPQPGVSPTPTPLPSEIPNDACVTDAEFFAEYGRRVFGECTLCHVAGGVADGESRYLLVTFDTPGASQSNLDALQDYLRSYEEAPRLLIEKPTNQVSHAGGRRFRTTDPEAVFMQIFIDRTLAPGECVVDPPATPDPCPPDDVQVGAAPLRRLTHTQIRNAVRDLTGVEVPEALVPATALDQDFRSWPINNTVSSAAAESMMLAAEHAAAHVDLALLDGCGAMDTDCARTRFLAWTWRAWRRPLTTAESDGLSRLFELGLAPDDAFRLGVEVVLQSPQFLYLDIAGSGTRVGASERLDPYAVASRMAFFLTQSTPDAELMRAARDGELATRAEIAVQARRLLDTPAVSQTLRAFHHDWLNTYRLADATRDPVLYPQFTPELVDAMHRELDLFVDEILWRGEGTLDALLSSRLTWVNDALAPLYGLPTRGDESWRRVELDVGRPGVLTRIAFLASHAYAAGSSPVRRGAFVLQDLLCENLSPPQDVDMEIPEPSEEARTIRERLAQHWTAPTCRACHTRIDPLGFAFENFGALGEWRDHWEDGAPIDATGSLEDPPGSFDGVTQMLPLVTGTGRVLGCYAQRWLEFALGRALDAQDQCYLDRVTDRFAASGGRLRELLIDVVLSDGFLYRPSSAEAAP